MHHVFEYEACKIFLQKFIFLLPSFFFGEPLPKRVLLCKSNDSRTCTFLRKSADPPGRACRPPRLPTYLPTYLPTHLLPFFFPSFLLFFRASYPQGGRFPSPLTPPLITFLRPIDFQKHQKLSQKRPNMSPQIDPKIKPK